MLGSSHRSVNALQLAHSGLFAGLSLRSLGSDSMVTQMTGECLAPFAERRLADMEPFALLDCARIRV
jgi:hypothetical protein